MRLLLKGRRAIIERIASDKIKKTYRKSYIADLKREVRALRILEKYEHFPKLLEVGDSYIVMTYVGKKINKKDSKKFKGQALEILQELKESGIKHRDAEDTHWRIMNEKLYLIDFGACNFEGEDNPRVRKFKVKMTDKEWVNKLFRNTCQ